MSVLHKGGMEEKEGRNCLDFKFLELEKQDGNQLDEATVSVDCRSEKSRKMLFKGKVCSQTD